MIPRDVLIDNALSMAVLLVYVLRLVCCISNGVTVWVPYTLNWLYSYLWEGSGVGFLVIPELVIPEDSSLPQR